MKRKSVVLHGVLAVSLVLGLVLSAEAALTASQRRDLAQARRALTRASSFLRRKKLDEAEKLIGKTEAAVKDRLSKEISYWDHRAEQLSLQEQAGKVAREAQSPAPEAARSIGEAAEQMEASQQALAKGENDPLAQQAATRILVAE